MKILRDESISANRRLVRDGEKCKSADGEERKREMGRRGCTKLSVEGVDLRVHPMHAARLFLAVRGWERGKANS